MRPRITRLTVLVAAVVVGVFAVPLVVVAFAYLVGDERAELERAADVAAITAADQLGAGRSVTSLAGAGREVAIEVALYDAGGHRVLGTGPDVADGVVRRAAQTGDARLVDGDVGAQLVVAVSVDRGSAAAQALTVRAASSRWDLYHHAVVVAAGMVVVGVLAPAAAWFLARQLALRLARPLQELARAARRLGDGDFTARGPASGIPEIDAVSDALADTADRIDTALARERAFSADASHQLRTPLAGLRLRLEAALEAPDADPRPALRAAVIAADRLQATVDDLLELARDTHRTGENTDPGRLLAEVAEVWGPPLAQSGRRLTVESRPDAPPSSASPGAARQILAVLVDNALTHGEGEVVLTAREAAGALAVDVSDQGPGVPDPGRLFARRAPAPRRADRASDGRGIGLALARSLAEAEGGRLLLATATPPTFTLLLPPPAADGAGRQADAGHRSGHRSGS